MQLHKIYKERLAKDDIRLDIINLLDLLFALLAVYLNPIFYLGVALFTTLYIIQIVKRKYYNNKINTKYNLNFTLYKVHIVGLLLAFIDLLFTLLIAMQLTLIARSLKFVVIFGRNITRAKAINNLSKLIPGKLVFKQIRLNKSKKYSIYKNNIKRRNAMIDKLQDIHKTLVEEKTQAVQAKEAELETKLSDLENDYKEAKKELVESHQDELAEVAQNYDNDIKEIELMIEKKQQKPTTIKATLNEDLSDREDAEELINEKDVCANCEQEECECDDESELESEVKELETVPEEIVEEPTEQEQEQDQEKKENPQPQPEKKHKSFLKRN